VSYICCVKYKKAKSGAVAGDPKEPVTKESVLKETKARFAKEFPEVSIPDSTLKNYSMVYLLSGMREDAMNKMISKERKRQKDGDGS